MSLFACLRCAAVVCSAASALSPTTASAAPVMMQYPAPTAANQGDSSYLTPIGPGDAGWVTTGAKREAVEYSRSPQGSDYNGTYLQGELWVDDAALAANPNHGAVLLMHGGMIDSPACLPRRRASMRTYAQDLARRGYIVFNVDFRVAPASWDLEKDPSLNSISGPGDCIPDDRNTVVQGDLPNGWGPSLSLAQASAQHAVRSLKTQLRRYANVKQAAGQANVAVKFRNASNKVSAMGASLGGHLAARLALRSDESDGGSDSTEASRRVSAAVGISAVGECTPGQLALSHDRTNPSYLSAWSSLTAPGAANRPFSTCDVEQPAPGDAPLRFFNAAFRHGGMFGGLLNLCENRSVECSPHSGALPWTNNIGWDRVIDARWPLSTCNDVNTVVPGNCVATRFKTSMTHQAFPGSLSTGEGLTVMNAVDALFKSANSYSW